MSLTSLPNELQTQILLNLDYRSAVRLASADRHFQALTERTMKKSEKTAALLVLEYDDPTDFLKTHDLLPCYSCLKVLPRANFEDVTDSPSFDLGGEKATHRVCGLREGDACYDVAFRALLQIDG
jgi:hypothetical protein